MKDARRRLLLVAILVVVVGAAWAWMRPKPKIRFISFRSANGQRCANFTLENGTGDRFMPEDIFASVKLERDWEEQGVGLAYFDIGPFEDDAVVGYTGLNYIISPTESWHCVVKPPSNQEANGRPFRLGITLWREPSRVAELLDERLPWLIPDRMRSPQKVVVWSEVVTP